MHASLESYVHFSNPRKLNALSIFAQRPKHTTQRYIRKRKEHSSTIRITNQLLNGTIRCLKLDFVACLTDKEL